MEDHKTIINVEPSGDGIQEEIFSKRDMEYKPHTCDQHTHAKTTPSKYKSELKINPEKLSEDEIQSQIIEPTDYSLTLEIKSPLESEKKIVVSEEHKHHPPISTITVQNRQGSELNNSCKINKPTTPTWQNGGFFTEENLQDFPDKHNDNLQNEPETKHNSVLAITDDLQSKNKQNGTSNSVPATNTAKTEEEFKLIKSAVRNEDNDVSPQQKLNDTSNNQNSSQFPMDLSNVTTSNNKSEINTNSKNEDDLSKSTNSEEPTKLDITSVENTNNKQDTYSDNKSRNLEETLKCEMNSGENKHNNYNNSKNKSLKPLINDEDLKETNNYSNNKFTNLHAPSKFELNAAENDENYSKDLKSMKNDVTNNYSDNKVTNSETPSTFVINAVKDDDNYSENKSVEISKNNNSKNTEELSKFEINAEENKDNTDTYSKEKPFQTSTDDQDLSETINKSGNVEVVSKFEMISPENKHKDTSFSTSRNEQSSNGTYNSVDTTFTYSKVLHNHTTTDKSVGDDSNFTSTNSNSVIKPEEPISKSQFSSPPSVASNSSSSSKCLRHVLTQTSVEPPPASSTKITPSRAGCAESGVLTPRAGTLPAATVQQPMSSMEEESLRERRRADLLRRVATAAHQEARYTKEAFKRLMQNQEFLEQLFKLFDQDQDSQLPQDAWVEFLKERLSDEKHIDFAEQIESVAYVLCGDGPITLDLFHQIFHAKGIVDKLFRLVDQDNAGTISAEQVMEFVSNITNTRPRTGFDKKSLESLEQLFRQTVGNGKEIRREDFQKIVISKNPFFTERVFQIFDKDNSGSISLQEFLDSMHQFAGQSPDDKIKFLFKIYDIDGDGLIQLGELQHVMRACMEENGMQFSDSQLSELTAAMFEDADAGGRGAITYEALKRQLETHGGLLENLTISIDRWLVPPKPKAPPAKLPWPYQLTRPYLKNNYVYLLFLAVFIALNVGLFVSRAVQYANLGSNGYVIVARACGQCLNFNCMFVLMLMLRQCITFLRTRGFSAVLPLDHHIYLHKVTGMLIAIFSLVHTIMHLLNFSVVVVNHPEVNSGNFTLAEWLLTSRPGLFGLVPGLANPTGLALFFILLVMFVCSQAFVRRGGCFEIFYWTHLLYIPFWVLLIFHGPNFWKWFIGPGVIYLVERVLRLAWMRSERGNTYISSGLLLPSKVTHLVIKRPLHLDFHPGDYVFVNIPAIAKYEWHPFTISSAPEQEDYMWLHIRAVGEWTNRLYNYFEREQEKLHNGEIAPLLPGGQTEKKVQVQIPTITPDNKPLRRLQASLKRKFSNRDPNRNRGDAQLVRYTHDRFTSDTVPHVTASDGEINNRASCSNETLNYPALPKSMSPEKRLQMLLFHQKVPLEKSLSMPDIQTKAKKRERLLVLREYMRSESEKSFDECQIRRARLQSLGLAYLSPQNKSLAQSFRYMRHKPTIIAFKTPSLENCEQRNSSSSLGSVGRQASAGSFSSPERVVEEGRAAPPADASPTTALKPVNYPVGKPLEPIPEDRSILEMVDLDESLFSIERLLGSDTEIYLDGPYGAPSSHIFRAQHAVLIATGIGVTPFASILQSIMHRYWKARHACPRCGFAWASSIPPAVMHLRKVDFFWINRDQRSFEWFVSLLSQLEIEQAELGGAMERFLDMHMYITSALQKTDMKAVGLQLALDLLHEKEKRDLITGLKTRTNAGRPNWDKVFKQLQAQKKGKVTVFYCGPPQLARILRIKCDQYGFSFRKETF